MKLHQADRKSDTKTVKIINKTLNFHCKASGVMFPGALATPLKEPYPLTTHHINVDDTEVSIWVHL